MTNPVIPLKAAFINYTCLVCQELSTWTNLNSGVLSVPNSPCGVSGPYLPGTNILGQHRPRANYRVISNYVHLRENHGFLSYVNVIAYSNAGRFHPLLNSDIWNYPFEKIVTHEFSLQDVEKGMQKSIKPNSMKVVIVPGSEPNP